MGYEKEPMPGHEQKSLRDPTAKYQIRHWYDGGIRDKKDSQVVETDLTLEDAIRREKELDK